MVSNFYSETQSVIGRILAWGTAKFVIEHGGEILAGAKSAGSDTSIMETQRGKVYGSGMALIALGTGAVDVKGTFEALQGAGFNGYTTLEIAGDQAVKDSYSYLKSLGAQ